MTKMMTGVMTFGLFLRSRRQFTTQSVCVARASLGIEPRLLAHIKTMARWDLRVTVEVPQHTNELLHSTPLLGRS